MAVNDNRKKIRFRRGDETNLVSPLNTEKIAYGQPIYNATKNYLSIGDSTGDKLYKNLRPLDVRRVKGYFDDEITMSGVASESKQYWLTGKSNNVVELYSQGGFELWTGNRAWTSSDPDAIKTFEVYRNQYAQFHVPMRTDTLKTQNIKTSTNDTDAITLSNNLITLNKDLSSAYDITTAGNILSTGGIAFNGATLGSKKLVIPSGTEVDILGKVNLGSNNSTDIINLNSDIRGFNDDGGVTPTQRFRLIPSIGRVEIRDIITDTGYIGKLQLGAATTEYIYKGSINNRVRFAKELYNTFPGATTVTLENTDFLDGDILEVHIVPKNLADDPGWADDVSPTVRQVVVRGSGVDAVVHEALGLSYVGLSSGSVGSQPIFIAHTDVLMTGTGSTTKNVTIGGSIYKTEKYDVATNTTSSSTDEYYYICKIVRIR